MLSQNSLLSCTRDNLSMGLVEPLRYQPQAIVPESLPQATTDTSLASRQGFQFLMTHVPSLVFSFPYKSKELFSMTPIIHNLKNQLGDFASE